MFDSKKHHDATYLKHWYLEQCHQQVQIKQQKVFYKLLIESYWSICSQKICHELGMGPMSKKLGI